MPYANPVNKANWQRDKRANVPQKIFVGVDGEGGDRDGVHVYTLFRIGSWHIYDPNGLEAGQVLRFILDYVKAYPDHILVSFFFDYDVTMILKDLPKPTIDYLLDREGGLWHFAKYAGFQIDYIPGKRFVVKDSENLAMIHDTSGFFQSSFLKAIALWDIATPEETAIIESGKGRRSVFRAEMTDAEIEYNHLECVLLARLMEHFCLVTQEIGLTLTSWQGAGAVATAILRKYKVPNRDNRNIPNDCELFARQAYYGGRFEVRKLGDVQGVRQYDLASAYPAAMASLPCLIHTKWKRFSGEDRDYSAEWCVARIDYTSEGVWGPFPCRTKDGAIMFPLSGSGWYWSSEIDAATRFLGTQVTYRGGWCGYRTCDCKPFGWVEAMYAERLALGKNGKGIVLKLGLNSLYGKFAQSVGVPKYATPIYAGLITADCRARLLSIFEFHKQVDVVMFATDAAYLTCKAKFRTTTSKKLGMFEGSPPEDLFIVKPGFYFVCGTPLVKSRGIRAGYLDGLEGKFRRAWEQSRYSGSVLIPDVSTFIGLKLARQLKQHPNMVLDNGFDDDAYDAGRWVSRSVRMTFSQATKRQIGSDGSLKPYRYSQVTVPYDRAIGMVHLQFTHPDTNDLTDGLVEKGTMP
ncbi:MAG: hypothetical protein JSR64_17115 [Nitrospira sp.]|nr:hypothetical protein [Nitrospira sp.]